jgi:hypothetical protein
LDWNLCTHDLWVVFFLKKKVNGMTYLEMLQDLNIELAESPVFAGHQMTLQQYGAPAHQSKYEHFSMKTFRDGSDPAE